MKYLTDIDLMTLEYRMSKLHVCTSENKLNYLYSFSVDLSVTDPDSGKVLKQLSLPEVGATGKCYEYPVETIKSMEIMYVPGNRVN